MLPREPWGAREGVAQGGEHGCGGAAACVCGGGELGWRCGWWGVCWARSRRGMQFDGSLPNSMNLVQAPRGKIEPQRSRFVVSSGHPPRPSAQLSSFNLATVGIQHLEQPVRATSRVQAARTFAGPRTTHTPFQRTRGLGSGRPLLLGLRGYYPAAPSPPQSDTEAMPVQLLLLLAPRPLRIAKLD